LRLVPVGPGGIIGRVFLREPLGLEDEVLVETSDGTRVRAVTASGEDYPESVEVGLAFLPRDLYLFDGTSKVTVCSGIDGV
jgi:hypothetical protein